MCLDNCLDCCGSNHRIGGLSRVYLGVYYPSDAVAGYVSASIWVLMVGLGRHVYGSGRVACREGSRVP